VKNSHIPTHQQTSSVDQTDDEERKHRDNSPPLPPSPPSPKFRTLLPGEQLDFESFQKGVAGLQDQCERLMGSLEESRRTIEALTAERDHYKEFWQAMNNYQSVMSRFQVPAAAAAITPGPLGSQIAVTLPSINALSIAALHPVNTTSSPGYPVYPGSGAQPPPSQQGGQPQVNAAPPDLPPKMDIPVPSTPEPVAATGTQSPETPSKRTIKDFFTNVKKPVVPPAPEKEGPAISRPGDHLPSPPPFDDDLAPPADNDFLAADPKPADHEPVFFGPERPHLEQAPKSQENTSTSPEDVSPTDNESDDENLQWTGMLK